MVKKTKRKSKKKYFSNCSWKRNSKLSNNIVDQTIPYNLSTAWISIWISNSYLGQIIESQKNLILNFFCRQRKFEFLQVSNFK